MPSPSNQHWASKGSAFISKFDLDIKKKVYGKSSYLTMSSNNRLIGLAGRKGVGKDVVADVLTGCGFQKRALALPLKTACRDLFLLSDDQLWGDSKEVIDKRYGKSPRELMQLLGTDFLRNMISRTFWTDRFREWYKAQDGEVVVSDVRFFNEVELIHELGGRVILIKREGLTSDEVHESEQAEKLVHHIEDVLHNDGTLEALEAKARSLVRSA